jgi:hypothetical protein
VVLAGNSALNPAVLRRTMNAALSGLVNRIHFTGSVGYSGVPDFDGLSWSCAEFTLVKKILIANKDTTNPVTAKFYTTTGFSSMVIEPGDKIEVAPWNAGGKAVQITTNNTLLTAEIEVLIVGT